MSRNAFVWMFRVRVRKKQEYLRAAETQSDEIIIAVRHCECEVGGKSLSPPAARPLIFTQPHPSHPPFRWGGERTTAVQQRKSVASLEKNSPKTDEIFYLFKI